MTGDKFFHDVLLVSFGLPEAVQLCVVGQFPGVRRTNAVIRLDDNGIADLGDKGQAAVQRVHQMIAGSLDTGGSVAGLHLGFILDHLHISRFEAGGDVEVRPQLGLQLQPIFILAVNKVDLAVFEGEECHGSEHTVIVLQRGDIVVFRQRIAAVVADTVIGAIANAQHVDTQMLQTVTEIVKMLRKMRRNENHIHGNASSLITQKLHPGRNLMFPTGFVMLSAGLAEQICPNTLLLYFFFQLQDAVGDQIVVRLVIFSGAPAEKDPGVRGEGIVRLLPEGVHGGHHGGGDHGCLGEPAVIAKNGVQRQHTAHAVSGDGGSLPEWVSTIGAVDKWLQLTDNPRDGGVTPAVEIAVNSAVNMVRTVFVNPLQVLTGAFYAHYDQLFSPVIQEVL